MRVLAISGSLRAGSTNTALLRAAARAAPAGMHVDLYDGLGTLPIYNADDDVEPPPAPVRDLRARIAGSDGVLIACPEYAHGIPGGLKNALDWIVSSGEMVGRPVALLHASPRSAISRAALAEVLRTIDARIVEEATCTMPLLGRQGSDLSTALDAPEAAAEIAAALARFDRAIGAMREPVTAAPE